MKTRETRTTGTKPAHQGLAILALAALFVTGCSSTSASDDGGPAATTPGDDGGPGAPMPGDEGGPDATTPPEPEAGPDATTPPAEAGPDAASSPVDAGATHDSSATDSGAIGSDATSCAMSCATGDTCCNGTCTSLAVDTANCGTCGHACPVSGATCTNGTCGCNPPKSTLCGQDAGVQGACADLTSDSHNCGGCGTACADTTPLCSNGSCVATCNTASGQTQCETQCVTLGNDDSNCGACGHACAASEVCSGGVCTPLSSVGDVGCADGTREVFANATTFPAIAACAGGWDGNGGMANYVGVFPAPLRTTSANCAQNGNSGPNPGGTGCSAADLCAAGWHICVGGEVIARTQTAMDSGTTDGCAADTWPANSFFAGAIGSTGCYECAEPYATGTGPNCTNATCASGCQANPGLTNDVFGCGSEGVAVGTCGDVDRSGGNACGSLDSGWSCATDGFRESVTVVHNPSPASGTSPGGVLCCKDI
jgi:hypothetical protein